MKQITRLLTCLLAVCLLSGCGIPFVGDDEKKKEPASDKPEAGDTKQLASSTEPTESAEPRDEESTKEVASPTDACDNIAGKQGTVPDGLRWLEFSTDGKLYCLSGDAIANYTKELAARTRLLVRPLRESLENDGSPQFALNELVQLGCDQSARDFMFWGEASSLYRSIVAGSSADETSGDWPKSYAAAIVEACF